MARLSHEATSAPARPPFPRRTSSHASPAFDPVAGDDAEPPLARSDVRYLRRRRIRQLGGEGLVELDLGRRVARVDLHREMPSRRLHLEGGELARRMTAQGDLERAIAQVEVRQRAAHAARADHRETGQRRIARKREAFRRTHDHPRTPSISRSR
jgi:hypothetical protein